MKPSNPVTKTILPALRAAGIKVRVRHERIAAKCYMSDFDRPALQPFSRKRHNDNGPMLVYPCGGLTTVDLLFPNGCSYSGVAKCSLADRFDRREGIRIALERALAARKAFMSGIMVAAKESTHEESPITHPFHD